MNLMIIHVKTIIYFYKIIYISKKVKKIENRHHFIQKWCLLEFTKVRAVCCCLWYPRHPIQRSDIAAPKAAATVAQTSHEYR